MRYAWLAALATLLVFARGVPYAFVRSWDDGRFIVDNAAVQHVSWDGFVRAFSSVQFEAYHPLHVLSYWLDVPWFGPSAPIVHAVSLGLWLIALGQVYALLRALEVSEPIAALCALACAIHPVQVEVVSWATGRKDVLVLSFVAASLRLQLTAAGPWTQRAWLARALYLAALLTKTTALPLPVFGFCLEVLARKKPWRAALLWQWPSCVLAAGISVLVMVIWRDHAMVRATVGGPELALVRVVQTLGAQLLTAMWPSRVSPMYGTQSIVSWQLARTLAVGAYLLLCGLAYRARSGLMLAGLLGFALWLAPAANGVPLYFPLQDRYASLPVFALSLALAGVASAYRGRRLPLMAAGVLVVCALGLRTVQYLGTWQSELRLWGHAVSTQPDAEYAYLKLGEVRRDAGAYEGAIRAYQGAIRVAPYRKLAHAGLFEAVARRDERARGMPVSRARALAADYYARLDQPAELQTFASMLWREGYVRALELPLRITIAAAGWSDALLTREALSALRQGQPTLARFFVHTLASAPEVEPLVSVARQPYLRVVP